ncbi:MAG: NHL repeat-containing protein [Thermomicrobiales bacterium]
MDRKDFTGISGTRLNRRAMLAGSAALGIRFSIPLRPAVAAQFDQSQIELVWQSAGTEETPLLQPDGVAVAPDGSIAVSNTKRNHILVLSSEGEFVEVWGEAGTGPGQFMFSDTFGSFIGDLDFDADGNCYVFDAFNFRVQKFSPEHELILEITGETDDVPFDGNVGGCVDRVGQRLFVTDFSDQVRVFGLDGSFLLKFGSNGIEDGQFFWPFDVAVAGDGSIYVGELKGKRAQKFDGEGNFLERVTEPELGTVEEVYYLAVDPDGNLFLTDQVQHVIRIYAPDATLLGMIEEVPGYGKIGLAAGLAFDTEGFLLVTDSFEHQVLKLKMPNLA